VCGGVTEKGTLKTWALLLIAVAQVKCGQVVWCQIKVCEVFRVVFGPIWLF
jgi:hypothetical protein